MLGAVLDSQRLARGLTWSQVAREISAGLPISGIAPSTISSIGTRPMAEADGVLQMLRWLHRTPESFVPGSRKGVLVPRVAPGKILRVDTRRLYDRLEARRLDLGRTRVDLARELGVTPFTLSNFTRGGRTAFPLVMRVTGLLGGPLAAFTFEADR